MLHTLILYILLNFNIHRSCLSSNVLTTQTVQINNKQNLSHHQWIISPWSDSQQMTDKSEKKNHSKSLKNSWVTYIWTVAKSKSSYLGFQWWICIKSNGISIKTRSWESEFKAKTHWKMCIDTQHLPEVDMSDVSKIWEVNIWHISLSTLTKDRRKKKYTLHI